jgi:hypothetical protein
MSTSVSCARHSGVAETGSVWLTESELKVNALAFLAQHLVVLLDPERIVGNMHDAYRDRARFDARYGVFMTGPSATADIEGVLIPRRTGDPQLDRRTRGAARDRAEATLEPRLKIPRSGLVDRP